MKESLIQSAIENYLRLMENMGKCVYTKNNTGAITASYKGKQRFFRFGRPGSPDFIVFLPGGLCLHLEVKNEEGEQNENQIKFQKSVEKLGHKYIVVRSVEEVEKIIK